MLDIKSGVGEKVDQILFFPFMNMIFNVLGNVRDQRQRIFSDEQVNAKDNFKLLRKYTRVILEKGVIKGEVFPQAK